MMQVKTILIVCLIAQAIGVLGSVFLGGLAAGVALAVAGIGSACAFGLLQAIHPN